MIAASVAARQGGDHGVYLDIARLAATAEPPPDDEVSTIPVRLIGGFAAMINGDLAGVLAVLQELAAWGGPAEEPGHDLGELRRHLARGRSGAEHFVLERAPARRRGSWASWPRRLAYARLSLAFEQQFDEAAVGPARPLTSCTYSMRPIWVAPLERWRSSPPFGAVSRTPVASADVIDRATQTDFLRASTAVYALVLADLGQARWSGCGRSA